MIIINCVGMFFILGISFSENLKSNFGQSSLRSLSNPAAESPKINGTVSPAICGGCLMPPTPFQTYDINFNASPLLMMNPGVQKAVGQVDKEIQHHQRTGEEKHHSGNYGLVPLDNGVNHV